MPSKYAFTTRSEVEQEQLADQSAQASQASALAAARRQAEEEELRRRRAALLSTLYTRVTAHHAAIIDILADYLETEYGGPISFHHHGDRPDLYAWFATRDGEPILTLFLLVQGEPPEAGLFVDAEERTNFRQLLIVLRTHTGLVAHRSQRAADLRERLANAVRHNAALRYKLP